MNAEVMTLKGEKYAVLPYDMWEKIQETLEDLRDIADANEIKARVDSGDEELYPAEVVNAMLEGENMVKVFRQYRGLTQEALAKSTGVSVSMIRQIEQGKSDGSVSTIKAIAKALNVDVEMII